MVLKTTIVSEPQCIDKWSYLSIKYSVSDTVSSILSKFWLPLCNEDLIKPILKENKIMLLNGVFLNSNNTEIKHWTELRLTKQAIRKIAPWILKEEISDYRSNWQNKINDSQNSTKNKVWLIMQLREAFNELDIIKLNII